MSQTLHIQDICKIIFKLFSLCTSSLTYNELRSVNASKQMLYFSLRELNTVEMECDDSKDRNRSCAKANRRNIKDKNIIEK